MPGRPKKKAKRTTELEELAVRLSADVCAAIPQMYLDKPDSYDHICRAWTDAVEATTPASLVIEHLGNLLRAKAGIMDPGPAAEIGAVIREVSEEVEA